MVKRPDEIGPEEWSAMLALAQFLKHDVMRADLAVAWLEQGILQSSPDNIQASLPGMPSSGALCIRFTTKGRKLTLGFMRKFSINASKLEDLPDPFEIENSPSGSTFLMHDRRFRREVLNGDLEAIEARYERAFFGLGDRLDGVASHIKLLK